MAKALVIGLGISGKAAMDFLVQKGFEVQGTDSKEEALLENSVLESQITDLKDFDLVVISPGVSLEHRLCKLAKEQNIELTGEAELAFRYCKQRCIGVTGTNGKTTVTLLIAHALNEFGIAARALGNIGEPLTRYFMEPKEEEVIVAELSSYQLETMQTPVFDVGLILNITPDHLDRYPSMQEYAAAKFRLETCVKPAHPFYVYLPALSYSNTKACKTFGRMPEADYWTDKNGAKEAENIEYILPLSYREIGIHESENALAAWLAVREFGVTRTSFYHSLETFKKPEHRIEFVKMLGGVAYYNDSKGTNLDATIQAIQSMRGAVVLIAGGVHKGASYQAWKEPFKDKVKRIIVIGEAADKITADLKDDFQIEKASTLMQAVEIAAVHASDGDSVLLSPGCSSYDMFHGFAHRGEEFKKYIERRTI